MDILRVEINSCSAHCFFPFVAGGAVQGDFSTRPGECGHPVSQVFHFSWPAHMSNVCTFNVLFDTIGPQKPIHLNTRCNLCDDQFSLVFREGSVVVNYELVFRGPMPSYNTTLRLACRGQDGHQTEPPEGWIGELILPNGLGTMDYEIPPDSRECRKAIASTVMLAMQCVVIPVRVRNYTHQRF